MTSPVKLAAYVGIDWADQEHAVALSLGPGADIEFIQLPHKAEAIDAWAAELRRRFDGQPVAVCLEQSRGALVYALLKYEHLVLFPINPKQLARYREAFAPSGPKDDPADARLLCRFVREHHDQLRAWRPDDPLTRQLRLLSEQRRHWVDERTALANRLLQTLKECYPLALELMGKQVYGVKFLKLLVKFPTQRQLQRASPRQLEQCLPRLRRVVDDSSTEQLRLARVASIRAAQALVTDVAVLESGELAVRHLAILLEQLNKTIAAYDEKLAALLAQHEDAPLFATLPGAGAAITPRLVAAFGSDRKRYASAVDLQRLSGVAPITIRSGKSCTVQMRRACPKMLRQTFHEFARCSLRRSAWATAYHAMLRAKGHGFHSAVRALAFKWLRILFRCWQTRQPYNEAFYLEQLRRKQSPLLAYLTAKSTTNH